MDRKKNGLANSSSEEKDCSSCVHSHSHSHEDDQNSHSNSHKDTPNNVLKINEADIYQNNSCNESGVIIDTPESVVEKNYADIDKLNID